MRSGLGSGLGVERGAGVDDGVVFGRGLGRLRVWMRTAWARQCACACAVSNVWCVQCVLACLPPYAAIPRAWTVETAYVSASGLGLSLSASSASDTSNTVANGSSGSSSSHENARGREKVLLAGGRR